MHQPSEVVDEKESNLEADIPPYKNQLLDSDPDSLSLIFDLIGRDILRGP
jgi:hypothetical protein